MTWIGSCHSPGFGSCGVDWQHAWQFSTADTVVNLGWGTGQPWAIAYALITLLVLIARRLPQQPQEK